MKSSSSRWMATPKLSPPSPPIESAASTGTTWLTQERYTPFPETARRPWKIRLDPDWHIEQQKKFEAEKNDDAAALHRSFEQHARGVVAVDYNRRDQGYWHFVAAALLKPPVPKAVEIEAKK